MKGSKNRCCDWCPAPMSMAGLTTINYRWESRAPVSSSRHSCHRSQSKQRGSNQNARPITRGGEVRADIPEVPYRDTHRQVCEPGYHARVIMRATTAVQDPAAVGFVAGRPRGPLVARRFFRSLLRPRSLARSGTFVPLLRQAESGARSSLHSAVYDSVTRVPSPAGSNRSSSSCAACRSISKRSRAAR
jgi:hypothetical protein